MAEEEDPPAQSCEVLSILQETVDISRSRRRRAERAGEAPDTIEGYYLVELAARLELAREIERRTPTPAPR